MKVCQWGGGFEPPKPPLWLRHWFTDMLSKDYVAIINILLYSVISNEIL